MGILRINKTSAWRLSMLPVVLASLLAAGSGCSSRGHHPSDDSLIQRFRDHEAEFTELLSMFLDDEKLGRVGKGFTRPADPSTVGVSPRRIGQYHDLFRKLDLPDGIEGYGDKSVVRLYASTHGLSVTGSSKGYAYLRSEPETVVPNLDEYWSEDGRSFTAFRHIKGHWYLYFDFED